MPLKRFRRTTSEYQKSRTYGERFISGRHIDPLHGNTEKAEECLNRKKDVALCYLAVGNISMMLNTLYTVNNYEEKLKDRLC